MPQDSLSLALAGSASLRRSARDRWRLAAALGAILFVAWTQVFLGIHELSHLGQTDASTCRFAQVVSTCSGGTAAAGLVLPAPLAPSPATLVVPARPSSAIRIPQQARAPPALV
jgi:hypothetical protein